MFTKRSPSYWNIFKSSDYELSDLFQKLTASLKALDLDAKDAKHKNMFIAGDMNFKSVKFGGKISSGKTIENSIELLLKQFKLVNMQLMHT